MQYVSRLLDFTNSEMMMMMGKGEFDREKCGSYKIYVFALQTRRRNT